jgi:ribosomal protein S18 acetylase RimI-like enzyme
MTATARHGASSVETDQKGTGHPADDIGVTLRPSGEQDMDFLFRVYADSRAGEMALIADWSDEQKDEFLRFQFRAQDNHYREHYPDARYDLILRDGRPIGRLYVCDLEEEIRLMDIALLATERNRGVGTALMQALLERATQQGKFVSLHVEEHNPAKRLYERLGFRDVADVSFYKLMHWHPRSERVVS